MTGCVTVCFAASGLMVWVVSTYPPATDVYSARKFPSTWKECRAGVSKRNRGSVELKAVLEGCGRPVLNTTSEWDGNHKLT